MHCHAQAHGMQHLKIENAQHQHPTNIAFVMDVVSAGAAIM